ncbi:copper ion-binding protein [Gemmatimonadetes bacterium T265]|nr:copper ion-binding protein [Gemmatimonadetes bacterium T265]
MKQLRLAIEGMSCGHCVASVRRALGTLDGVEVQDVAVGAARVAYDPARTRADAIAEAVRDEGYAAQPVPVVVA